MRELQGANRRLFRGWQRKDKPRELLRLPLVQAKAVLHECLAWASRSKLAPIVTLARISHRYRVSIEATIEWKLTNGIAGSNKAAVGRLRSAACGFHDPQAFITMIMSDRALLAPDLLLGHRLMAHGTGSRPRKLLDVTAIRALGWSPSISLGDGIGATSGRHRSQRAPTSESAQFARESA